MQGFGSELERSLASPAQGASPELELEVRTPYASALPSSPGPSRWLSPLCVPSQFAPRESQPDAMGGRVVVGNGAVGIAPLSRAVVWAGDSSMDELC